MKGWDTFPNILTLVTYLEKEQRGTPNLKSNWARGHEAHRLTTPLELLYSYNLCQHIYNIHQSVNLSKHDFSILHHVMDKMILNI